MRPGHPAQPGLDRCGAARVGVVVVNHNAGPALFDCLRSISGQAAEVVVVDNASLPPDQGGIPGAGRTIRLARNLGFAAGCNIGIAACTQEAVLLLNPDCIAPPGLVARLWETLRRDTGIGIVGGFLQNPDGSEQRGGRRLVPTPFRTLARGLGLGFLARRRPSLFPDFNLDGTPLPREAVEVEAVSGACMLLRRAALEDAGMMDEGFFLHCEDLDLCLRFRQRGWKVFFDPQARVVHQKGVCGRQKPAFVEWHKHRGMVRFYKKHFRAAYPAVLFPAVFLAVWMRFLAVVAIPWIRPRRQPSNPPETPVYRGPPQNGAVVGVPGASGFVGGALVPLLLSRQFRVVAFSRRERRPQHAGLEWGKMDPHEVGMSGGISNWISLCPLPVLAGLLPKLAAYGARRLVAVSSTSRFTKADSRDAGERRLAESLAAAEEGILKWGRETGVEVVVLRPTLVYDGVGDKNIAAVSKFIRRWGWFPVLAPASGLRQPLHAADLAAACVAALSPGVPAGAYDLSGGETLPYREMVARIFAWQGVPQRLVEVPPWLLRFFGILPPFRGVTAGIFERMNKDLVFDHARAAELLDFRPRKFVAPALPPPPW